MLNEFRARRRHRRRRIRFRPGHAGGGCEAIPTLAFEPNVVPGFANRMVARFVSAAAVHFEETANISAMAKSLAFRCARRFSRFRPRRGGTPTLLVFGGSQGAHAINQVMIPLPAGVEARGTGIHIIHQTGERDYNEAQAAYAQMGESARSIQVHRRHAGGLRARRSGAVPLGREHGGGNRGGREAGGFCSVSARCG